MFLGHRSWEQLLCGEFHGGNCPRRGLFKGNCMGGKSPEMSKCPGRDFIGENYLGLVVKGELFKGNCPGVIVLGGCHGGQLFVGQLENVRR